MYVRVGGRSAKQPLPCGGESMAELEIYVYSSCTSCRKAEELLREKGVDAERRDYFKERFTKPELMAVLKRAGVTPLEVLSTRSNPYRELGLAGRYTHRRRVAQLDGGASATAETSLDLKEWSFDGWIQSRRH